MLRFFPNGTPSIPSNLALEYRVNGQPVNDLEMSREQEMVGGHKACVILRTALKINMEHNHGGLEDHFPFQMGDL